jgi:hypothetical protein
MKRFVGVVLFVASVALVVGAGVASAQDAAPVVSFPRAGDLVAPRIEVSLQASPRTLQVIWTDAFRADTGEFITSVPGIRHLSDAKGAYRGAVAGPRVYLGLSVPVRFEMHLRNGANQGDPETVIDLLPADSGQTGMAAQGPGSGTPGGPPTVLAPADGARLGPRTEVRLKATAGVLQVIWGDVIRTDTGEVVSKVPGIRHMPEADGSYSGAIATPRPRLGRDIPVQFRLNFRNGANPGDPTTTITGYPSD